MSGIGMLPITSALPRIRRPSGWSPKIAEASTSWTRSEGSSSYIAISSITTWRSESMSGKVGRRNISASTSKAASVCSSTKREYRCVVSLPVAALVAAPRPSKYSEISIAE